MAISPISQIANEDATASVELVESKSPNSLYNSVWFNWFGPAGPCGPGIVLAGPAGP